MHKYYAKMSKVTADIGFAYVTNNRFNRAKSPIKVEEYMAAGLPVICGKTLYEKTIDTSHCVAVIAGPDGLANAMVSYGNLDLARLTADAFSYVKDKFSLQYIGDYVEAELIALTQKPLYPILEEKVKKTLAADLKNKSFNYPIKRIK